MYTQTNSHAARLKGLALVALALVLALAGGPLALTGGAERAEAGGIWSAWLYSEDTGRLVRVFADGSPTTELTFPLPPGTSQYPYQITFSRGGNYLAACLTDDAGNPSVRVYDLFSSSYVAAYIPPGPIVECHLGRYAFSEDETQIAFGLLNKWPDDPGPRPTWEVIVMELNTSAVLHRIGSDNPTIAALGVDTQFSLPFVQTFQQQTATYPGLITFKPVRWATEGFCEYQSLTWQLDTNEVRLNDTYGKNSLDIYIAQSEIVWTEVNPAYPTGELMGPGCLDNVVMYSNKAGDRYPIFVRPGAILWGSTFVDDGEHVVVSADEAGIQTWYAIDRSGGVQPLPGNIEFQVWGAPGGYVFLTGAYGGTPQLNYHEFNAAGGVNQSSLWTGPAGNNWRIVWMPLLGAPPSLTPFPPAGVPAPVPTSTPGVPPVATPTPVPPPAGGELAVGGRAQVFTTEGDLLRVRTGPGLGFGVAYQFASGTIVTLLEGPFAADGYQWWRIEDGTGRMGWAVEGVTESTGYLQTLLPVP